jgi:hypothetical protein
MKDRRILRQLLFAGLCFAVAATLLWQYREKHTVTRIPLVILKETGFPSFKARVNGREIVMAVDTAANTTTFDIRLLDELVLSEVKDAGTSFRLAGGKPLRKAHLEKLEIGPLSYRGDFHFVDLSSSNEGLEAAGDPALQGLLGADFLVKWNAVIDYQKSCIIIRKQ